jgi:4-amino-4-deoxy-L-arabinose transferase-like glycosyltransferase
MSDPRSAPHAVSTPLLLALALSLLPLFTAVGSLGLVEPEETRYAEMAREMTASGDWLVPTLRGFPYLEKPPLTTWLGAIAFELFGVSELTARLPSLLAAVVALGLVFFLGRRAGGRDVALVAVLVLATAPLFFGMSRLVSTDVTFLAAVTAALGALLALHERPTTLRGVALGVATALAMLIKGPLGVLLVGLGAIALALVDRSWRVLLRSMPVSAILAFLAIAAPWFIAVSIRHPSFLDFFFVHHHLERLVAGGDEPDLHPKPFTYYVPIVIGGFLPWILFTPAAIRRAWKHRDPETRIARVLWVWAALVLAFFMLSSGKRVPYVLPIWPALAVGLAPYLAERLLHSERAPRVMLYAWAPMAVLAIASAWPLPSDEPRPELVAIAHLRPILVVTSALGFVLVAWFLSGGRRPRVALLVMTAMMSALFLTGALGLRNLEPYLSMRPIVQRANQLLEPRTVLIAFPRYRPGLSYYSDRPVMVVGAPHELDYGMSLRGDLPSPVIDDQFEALRARPGSLVLVGPADRVERGLATWREDGTSFSSEVAGDWMLVHN